VSTSVAPPRPFRAAGPVEAIRALALGANVWAIMLLLPIVHGGVARELDALMVALPLLPLSVGAYALAIGGRPALRSVAVAMLLLGFPVTLAGALALRADLADRDVWGALGLSVGALSALAYGGVVAEACSRPIALRTSVAQSLTVAVVEGERPARTWLRRAVLGGSTLGALAIAVVAPSAGSRAALIATWGDAADEATVLASIVGTGAAALALAVLLGPGLRAPRPSAGARARVWVVGIAIGVAIAASAGYALLRIAEGR
jgi:hypothetical protein